MEINLDDARLIDTLLHTRGKGEKLLTAWRTLHDLAQNLDVADLTPKQREVMVAAFKLSLLRDHGPVSMRSPADAFAQVADLGMEQQEHLEVLLLNTRNVVMERVPVYVGSLNTSLIRIAELFRMAIVRSAAAIVLVHNHPSGTPDPSPEDVAVTRSAVAVGKELDIEVLDHIIVGGGRFVSLKERGLMPN